MCISGCLCALNEARSNPSSCKSFWDVHIFVLESTRKACLLPAGPLMASLGGLGGFRPTATSSAALPGPSKPRATGTSMLRASGASSFLAATPLPASSDVPEPTDGGQLSCRSCSLASPDRWDGDLLAEKHSPSEAGVAQQSVEAREGRVSLQAGVSSFEVIEELENNVVTDLQQEDEACAPPVQKTCVGEGANSQPTTFSPADGGHMSSDAAQKSEMEMKKGYRIRCGLPCTLKHASLAISLPYAEVC